MQAPLYFFFFQNGERLFTLMAGVQSVPIRSHDWKMLSPEWAGRVELRGSYLQIKEASFGDKETDVGRNGRQNGERLFTLMPGVQSVPIRSFDWKMLTPEWAGRVELRCFSSSAQKILFL
ncbi:hypothetical protein CDAR_564481 [Caerostris darwini]|uniref:Uncharacterized protein n=1 Tax=Caerostris darwini TaxID=1538125 RepID=A0AAV4THB7_9ARAC|nr:hypothetical protein CDAR_564481 [Caerostris darwini]